MRFKQKSHWRVNTQEYVQKSYKSRSPGAHTFLFPLFPIKTIKNIPSGGKPRQRFERFWKNVVFAIAKLLTFISKILEFSRGKSSGFNIMVCKLQGFLCWKLARIFFPFSCTCACPTCDQFSPKYFLWSSSDAIAKFWCCACVSQVLKNVNIPHPTQPKKWRSMRVCRKFSRTSTSPIPPNPRSDVACACVASSENACIQKTLKTLARFSPRWQKHASPPTNCWTAVRVSVLGRHRSQILRIDWAFELLPDEACHIQGFLRCGWMLLGTFGTCSRRFDVIPDPFPTSLWAIGMAHAPVALEICGDTCRHHHLIPCF